MKIKEIEIKGLYNMFHHIVPLNLEEHITIIYGINGIGKTMLFKILDSFFNMDFNKLIKYPFQTLIIKFENDNFIELNNNKTEFIIHYVSITSQENKELQKKTWNLSEYKSKKLDDKLLKDIQHFIPVSIFSNDEFYDHRTEQIISIEQVLDNYEDELPPRYRARKIELSEQKGLEELINNIKIFFIQTQRLLVLNYEKKVSRISNSAGPIKVDTVLQYSQELSQLLQEKHKEYAKKSEEYEISLGRRLRKKEVTIFENLVELKTENEKLEKRRTELKNVGLLENIKEESIIPNDDIEDIEKAVLSVNIQDMKKKLQIFDDLYKKLNLFLDILNNRRFSYKKIAIDSKKGFVFTSDNNDILEVTELSSGEQHEIVLLYDLLFKVAENSLVLLDEPEISLHIVWQKEFLSDLKEITQLRNFDILIATHSPSIINGNWDLTVELKREKNEKSN